MKLIDELIIGFKKISDDINNQLFTGNYYQEFECVPKDIPEQIIDEKYFEHDKKLKLAKFAYDTYKYIKEKYAEFISEKSLANLASADEKNAFKSIVIKDIPIFLKKLIATKELINNPTPELVEFQKAIAENFDHITNSLCSHTDPYPEYKMYFERFQHEDELLLQREAKKQLYGISYVGGALFHKSAKSGFAQLYLYSGNFLERINPKVGYCGEHAAIALVRILNKYAGKIEQIELISIEYINDDFSLDDCHVFLAINRDKDSKLNDISSWGEKAILFDSWNKLVCKAKDFNTLPNRYFAYTPGLECEGVAHCAKWRSIPFLPHGLPMLNYIQREDAYYCITGNVNLKMRKANIIDEYQLISLKNISLLNTRKFLAEILNDLESGHLVSDVQLFITTAGHQLISHIPGLQKPAIAIHRSFITGLENEKYNLEELKFGLIQALLQVKQYPIQIEYSLLLTDQHFLDWQALQICKDGDAAISYLQKSHEFQKNPEDDDSFTVYFKRIYAPTMNFGERIKLLHSKLAQKSFNKQVKKLSNKVAESINEIKTIKKPTYFNDLTFQQCDTTVKKIEYLKSRLPELKKELIPFEVTHQPSVRLREYCRLLGMLKIDLSQQELAESVDELLNTAFELKIPGFDLIYKVISGNLERYAPLKMLGIFKELQQSITKFVLAKDYNTALAAAQMNELLSKKLKNHFAWNIITESFDLHDLCKKEERYFGSTIGNYVKWKGFTNKYKIWVKNQMPKELKPNLYLFINQPDKYELYFVDDTKKLLPIDIDQVKGLKKLCTKKIKDGSESKIKSCIAQYIIDQYKNLPWDEHLNWAKEDSSQIIARSLWRLGVTIDFRLWDLLKIIDIINFINSDNENYISPLTFLKGEFQIFTDRFAYSEVCKAITFYLANQHRIDKQMFRIGPDFETAFINFYKANFHGLTWGQPKLNKKSESVHFLIENFTEIAKRGTTQEKNVVRSFFLGRKDELDLENLRAYNDSTLQLGKNSPYTKFFFKFCKSGTPYQLFTIDDYLIIKQKLYACRKNIDYILSLFQMPDENLQNENSLDNLESIVTRMIKNDISEISVVIKHYLRLNSNIQLLSSQAAFILRLVSKNVSVIDIVSRKKILTYLVGNLPNSFDDAIDISCEDLISIYQYFDASLSFPSFSHQEILGTIIFKKIELIDDVDIQIKHLNTLIAQQNKFILSDVRFRDKIIHLYIKNILKKYGKDLDQERSTNDFFDVVTFINKNSMRRDVPYFLAEIGNAIEAQKKLSHFIGEKADPEKYFVIKSESHDKKYNLIPLFSFIAKEKQTQLQMINFLSSSISHETIRRFADYLFNKDMHVDFIYMFFGTGKISTQNTLYCSLQLIYNQFWNQTLDERAALIDFLLIPTEEVLSVEKFNLAFTNAFDFVVKKLFPNALANVNDPFDQENFAVAFLKAYLNTANRYQRNYLLAGMLVTTNEVDNEKKINVGRKLATLCEHLGPAYVKLAQAIHSYPQTPEDIRKELEHIKGRANPPKRWDLWRLITDVLPAADQAKIERVGSLLGSASFNLALDVHLKDGSDVVLLLLRENAKKDADQGFNHLRAAIDDCKHPLMTSLKSTALSLIDEAKELSIAEMDEKSGDTQGEIAKKLYGAFKNVQVDDYKVSIFPSTTLISGPGYRFITRVYGTEFNDLPQATARDKNIKKVIAKVIMQIELGNILRGDYFDCDRHGNQLRITTDFSKREINIGLYDFGEMALSKPTDEEMQQLAGFLSTVVSCLFRQKGLAVGLSEYIDKEIQAGKSVQYLMRVRKGLLALQDFQKHLTNQDLFEILNRLAAQQVIHPIIKYEFSKSLLIASGLFSLYKAKCTVESGMRYVSQFFYNKRNQGSDEMEYSETENTENANKKRKMN